MSGVYAPMVAPSVAVNWALVPRYRAGGLSDQANSCPVAAPATKRAPSNTSFVIGLPFSGDTVSRAAGACRATPDSSMLEVSVPGAVAAAEATAPPLAAMPTAVIGCVCVCTGQSQLRDGSEYTPTLPASSPATSRLPWSAIAVIAERAGATIRVAAATVPGRHSRMVPSIAPVAIRLASGAASSEAMRGCCVVSATNCGLEVLA